MDSIKVIGSKKIKAKLSAMWGNIKYARVMPLDFRLTNVFFCYTITRF